MFKKRKVRNVPIIGIHGAGKTYFIISLGYFISLEKWGEVETPDYFFELSKYVLAQQPIPPTVGYHPIRVRLDYVEYGNKRYHAKIILSTGDISGIEFERAMEEIGSFKFSKKSDLKKASPNIRKLYSLLLKSDGIIVIIDIARYMSESISRGDAILKAFSDQILPIARAIEMVMSFTEFSLRPLFFVFSKQDIHGLTVDEIRPYFDSAWAILLRRLESRLINIKTYAVSSVGWSSDPLKRLRARGFNKLLYDLVLSFQD